MLPAALIGPLIGLVGSAVGAGASLLAPKPKAPPVPLTPVTPAPIQQPQGNPATNAPQGQPSFLAAAAAPQQSNVPGKTLLGQ